VFLLAACVCVCLGLYAILVFPRFLCVVICAVAVSLIATCVLLASRVYMCVRPGKLLCGL
jgi:small neutral amino acid transporter SnatA (MarC family)